MVQIKNDRAQRKGRRSGPYRRILSTGWRMRQGPSSHVDYEVSSGRRSQNTGMHLTSLREVLFGRTLSILTPCLKEKLATAMMPKGGSLAKISHSTSARTLPGSFSNSWMQYDVAKHRSGNSTESAPYGLVRQIRRVADQYDIPQIIPRFFAVLCRLAPIKKENALMLFSAAFEEEDQAMARFAIQNFRDLCHPLLLSISTFLHFGSFAWRFLCRAVPNYPNENINWHLISQSVRFPES